MMHKCPNCDFVTENGKVLSNHIRWKHANDPVKLQQYKEKLSQKLRVSIEKRCGHFEYKNIQVVCAFCGKTFTTLARYKNGEIDLSHKRHFPKKCCSRSCASRYSNSFCKSETVWTEDKREAQAKKSRELWQSGRYDSLLQTKRTMWNSQREIEIREYLKKTHDTDEWHSGPLKESKALRFNVDAFSRILRVVFEYDGVWHFKDIYGQLERKQKRDAELESWCLQNNWRLVRIDEEKKLSLEEVESLIYKRSDPVIKIGDRYAK